MGIRQPPCHLIWLPAFPSESQKLTQYDSVLGAKDQTLLGFVRFLKSRHTQALFNYFPPLREEGVGS